VQAGTRNNYRGLYFIDSSRAAELDAYARRPLQRRARRAARPLGLRPALDGDHSFRRFNPALGVNWNPPGADLVRLYTQVMRVPAPAELTCADATAPCSLPNQFPRTPRSSRS